MKAKISNYVCNELYYPHIVRKINQCLTPTQVNKLVDQRQPKGILMNNK